MAAKRFPLRWWLTTGLAASFVVLFVMGAYQNWPGLVTISFVLGFCLIQLVVERHNEREADIDQIWWVPSTVLWGSPSRVALSVVLMLAMVAAVALTVFGGVGPWLLFIVVAVAAIYRVTLGRKWLKQDRAALAEAAPEGAAY
ncbi:hypothetical protein [Agreia pratensis]|uniref:Uncharacterized protein n=1 Tax=Agreia pratensis TaxID=150121 RepID=A0A1X7J918_9MICO|nr:hypothetical protein [Agreia pratensis]SMG23922.1 hypothetical protein SAMN06296010_1135 [Agreia pratensis]